jgi:hypothetical protein
VWNWSIGVACFETAIGTEEGTSSRYGREIERKIKERAGRMKAVERKEDKTRSNNNGRRKGGVKGNRKKWKKNKN